MLQLAKRKAVHRRQIECDMSRDSDSYGRDSAHPSRDELCLHEKGLDEKPIQILTKVHAALELDYQRRGLDRNERPMLPPFIIEQIRKREEEERRRNEREQPRLELPLDVHRPAAPREEDGDSEGTDRGVVIVDLLGDG
jgi:hypothetical protein